MTDTIFDMIAKDLSKYHIEQMLDVPKMRYLIDLEEYRVLITLACNPPPHDSRKPIYWFDAIVRVVDLIEKIRNGDVSIESADVSARDWRDWIITVFCRIENRFCASEQPYEYFEDCAKVIIASYSLLSVYKYGELTFKYMQ